MCKQSWVYVSCCHLLLGIIHSRRRTLLLLLLPILLPPLPLLFLRLQSSALMVLILPVDILGLADLIVGLPLYVAPQLLLVDHPTVVLTIVAVTLLLLRVLARGETTVEPPLDPLDLVFLQLVPDWIRGDVLSVQSCMAPPFTWGLIASWAYSGELKAILQEESLIHSMRKWGLTWKQFRISQLLMQSTPKSSQLFGRSCSCSSVKLGVSLSLKNSLIGEGVLSPACTFSQGQNCSIRALIFNFLSCRSSISSRRMLSRYWILPVSRAFLILKSLNSGRVIGVKEEPNFQARVLSCSLSWASYSYSRVSYSMAIYI